MQTKLTLRLDSSLIALAKRQAAQRKKSVSQLIADYVASLSSPQHVDQARQTPLVASMRGLLKGKINDPQRTWRRHLEEKYQ